MGFVSDAVQTQKEKAQEKEVTPPPLIQIAGLQRSGTGWIRRLLESNFALKVRSHHKHEMPNAYYWNVSPKPTRTFVEDLEIERALAVVVRKHFSAWVESVNRVPGILKPLYTSITDKAGFIPAVRMRAARDLHWQYYAEWRDYPQRAVIVQYEDALADTAGFLEWLREEYRLPTKASEWDLIDTWLEGPERERYIPDGVAKSWRGSPS
jgi:hypothetical protein